MACNTCRSDCGDCSEGSITFKRVVRSHALDTPPIAQAAPEQTRMLLLSEHEVKVYQAQEAQK